MMNSDIVAQDEHHTFTADHMRAFAILRQA